MDKVSILILDDEQDILDELRSSVERAGFLAVTTIHPAMALRHLEEDHTIRVLVSDVRMPGWDGLDLVQTLTQNQLQDRAQIIFMSGYASREHVQRAIRLDAVDFLFKPFKESEFVAAVRRALRRDLEQRQLKEIRNLQGEKATNIEAQLRYLHSTKEEINHTASSEPSDTETILRKVADARALRYHHFPPEFCSGAIWNMLIDLMVARLAKRPDYVSSLAVGAGVPLTTALRHLDYLSEHGMIHRQKDPSDRRRVLLWLTDEAATRMERYLDECANQKLYEL